MKARRLLPLALPALILPLAAFTPVHGSKTQPMAWGSPSHGGPSCSGSGCWEIPQPSGPAGAVSVDAENTFNLAIMPDGRVEAWGAGTAGDLGDGSTASSQTPVQVFGLSGVTMTGGGDSDAVALQRDGSVWTWGNNDQGQLGIGSTGGYRVVPARVSLPGRACGVDAGGFHMYALLCSGQVYAWGWGRYGQLGDGGTASSDVPVRVKGLTGVTAISSGNLFGYAKLSSGAFKDWGYNRYGQLCDGTTRNRRTPGPVPSLTGVSEVSAGGNVTGDGHVLALLPDRTVEACGDNASGQLGTGRMGGHSATPVQVSGLRDITAIAAGGSHSLALDGSGKVWAWGGNEYGQVGDGSTKNSDVPVKVLLGERTISAGSTHSLAAP